MTEEKGLDPVIADKIGEYVKYKGKVDHIIAVSKRSAEHHFHKAERIFWSNCSQTPH